MTRYSNSSGISHHQGEEPGQRRLGKTKEGIELPQWNQILETEAEGQQPDNA